VMSMGITEYQDLPKKAQCEKDSTSGLSNLPSFSRILPLSEGLLPSNLLILLFLS